MRDQLARLDRVQESRLFKLIATGVIILAALGGMLSYALVKHSAEERPAPPVTASVSGGQTAAEAPGAAGGAAADGTETQAEAARRAAMEAQEKSALEATQRAVDDILSARRSLAGVNAGIAIAAGLAIGVVWLGLGLTYLGLLVAAGAVAYPLGAWAGMPGMARFIAGTVVLTAAFTTLMQLLRLGLSAPGPVMSVAKNVLTEAVRMKVSLVFIMLLILGLAVLPGTLNEAAPLRYRVQSFLQYGTAGAYWIIAILTVTFSVATVAFEQRDRTIWQTMTKPVSSWQYILGKWIGVSALAAALIGVSAAGVFLFTEYLRSGPALGETSAYVAEGEEGISEDRFLLETQVLTARVVYENSPPEMDMEQVALNVNQRIESELQVNPEFADLPNGQISESKRAKLAVEVMKGFEQTYRAIGPGESRRYFFDGLGPARGQTRPVVFRYRIDSGSNRPDQVFKLTFSFSGGAPVVRESVLGQYQNIELLTDVVDDKGSVTVLVANADVPRGIQNPETISFQPGSLQMSYSAGDFRWNFLRVAAVLWVKLALMAMVGIFAATFASFPVACLLAFGVFLCAESSDFLLKALENYSTEDIDRTVIWHKVIIANIATLIGNVFKVYGELNPVDRLVDGRLMPWGSVAKGLAVLALGSGLFFAAAGVIFRRRELATYSGK
ncbi:MAG: ABC transporter permease subunit [Phycisphaerales bacterium]|nr:ABC transporter permease subunit [Phycisphaerales bacterium]